MTQEDIVRMAREAGLLAENEAWVSPHQEAMERFAAMIEQHLIASGYRQCAKGQRTTQYCGQVEPLRVDAERYRWLRDPKNAYHDAWNYFGPDSTVEEIDAAIDAARSEG